MKNLSLIVKYVFITPWCPPNKLEYRVIILSTHVSGTERTAVSFSEVILNNSESSRMYYSTIVSILLITNLEEGSLFCDGYIYSSLKYELCKYISLYFIYIYCLNFLNFNWQVSAFQYFSLVMFNILSISIHFGKYL